jgi:hypothetical protein
MINSILNYILKREAYRKYTNLRNLNTQDKASLFENLGKIAWLILWASFCLWAMISLDFIGGLSLFILPISVIRVISSFISVRKKTRPIYSDVPIKKSDRRYKTGYKIDGYKQLITGHIALTEEEINIRKNHFKGRLYFWGFILCISVIVFSYSYNNAPVRSSSNLSSQDPWGKAKLNDKVYVTKEAINNTITGITIYQLARPINKSDIKLLKVSDWRKRQMIDKLDTTLTNELIEAFEYNSDYFYKNNSSLIGTYVEKDSVLKVNEEYEKEWIEIILTNKNKKFKSILYNDKEGYVFENRYFIKASQTSMVDFMKYKNKKLKDKKRTNA